jgi:hypothetical protein
VERFAVAPSIRHVEVEGLRVILDLGTERYRILDDAATTLWPVLIGERDAAAAYAAAAAEYDLDQDRWGAELAAFARRCLEEGLLVRDGSPAPAAPEPLAVPRAPRRRPATQRALTSLVETRRTLRRRGLRVTYVGYSGIAVRPEREPLDRALEAFTRAENLFVTERAPGDCLLRSLSLYRFLRSVGCPAEHVMGVRRFAFAAHAWVECDGAPVLDDRAHEFTPIARIEAPAAPA